MENRTSLTNRSAQGAWLLAVVVGTGVLAASPRPADATFTVAVSGATTTVTQTDTDTLIVTQMHDGSLILSDSGPLVASPPTTNLVIRGATASTTSMLFVVLESELTGSLMLDLPGASNATVRGTVGSVGGTLRVKGGAGKQIVHLGGENEPLTVRRTATVDLGDGVDELFIEHGGHVVGSLNVRNVNDVRAVGLSVDRSLTFDTHGEDVRSDVSANALVVGRSLKVIGGPNVELVSIHEGTLGRSATLDFGGESGLAYLFFDTIGGNVKASYGADHSGVFALGSDTVLEGSLALTMPGMNNSVYIDGTIEGTSIKVTGGPGDDELDLNTPAPRANATISMGGGEDDVYISAERLRLKRLKLDLGDDVDVFQDNGWIYPPGSTVTGLP